jgi:hypothetical protein
MHALRGRRAAACGTVGRTWNVADGAASGNMVYFFHQSATAIAIMSGTSPEYIKHRIPEYGL